MRPPQRPAAAGRAAAVPVVVLVCAPAQSPEGILLETELVDPRTGRLAKDATGALVFTAGSAMLACGDLVAGACPLRRRGA